MNRDQKAATIEALASEIKDAQAIFAVDYRGLSVPQAAELRAKLREADASFTVVKNSLTERAADQVGREELKSYLTGPTALTFVRGDVALAAKAIADYARATQLLPFKGGLMDGAVLDIEQIRTISRLPAREVLYGQLVGIVASPVSGLVRTLNALISGLAVSLGQVQAKKESGEITAGGSPAAAEAPAQEPVAGEASAEEVPAEEPQAAETPASEEATATEEPPAAEVEDSEEVSAEEPLAEEALAEEASAAEPEQDEPAQDDNQDASEQEPDSAEATKED
jgi:large subunit ribosomal protein L10